MAAKSFGGTECNSNNDPRNITKYYLDYVKQVSGSPCIIRVDRGTENGNIAVINVFLRRFADDHFRQRRKKFIIIIIIRFTYGRSTAQTKELKFGGVFFETML